MEKQRKFKLIREYPDSLSVNTIFEGPNDAQLYWDKGKRMCYQLKHLKTEYFEEIVDKDYEILSFISPNGITEYFKTQLFIPIINNYEEYTNLMLNNPVQKWSIHSVKRSDGEVFTIGDDIQYSGNQMDHYPIKSITLKNDFIYLNVSVGSRRLDSAIKYIKKNKLFTTEDGVDIYDGDEVYPVRKNLDYISPSYNFSRFSHKLNPDYFYFSTKEKAKEYIILNKPCLSLNDVKSIGNYVAGQGKDQKPYDRLLTLVKQKLNL